MCIDYRKLNTATRKYHFPLPFIDQMLDRLVGHPHFCFLDGYSGYNQLLLHMRTKRKLLSHALMVLLLLEECHLGYAMLLLHFKDA